MKGQINTILLGIAVVLLAVLLGMQLIGGGNGVKEDRLNAADNQKQGNPTANANAGNQVQQGQQNQPSMNQNNPAQNQNQKQQKNKPSPREKKANNAPKTSISFEKKKHDFGEIQEGDVVTETFSFQNSGQEPLIIANAKGSCGCTVPSWPKEPIPPGESGEIDVKYNSSNKKGNERKTVTLTANTEPKQTRLTITADVKGGDGGDNKQGGSPQIKRKGS